MRRAPPRGAWRGSNAGPEADELPDGMLELLERLFE
jgi:hypothetical protein